MAHLDLVLYALRLLRVVGDSFHQIPVLVTLVALAMLVALCYQWQEVLVVVCLVYGL